MFLLLLPSQIRICRCLSVVPALQGKTLHVGANQLLLKYIAAHPVLFVFPLETANSTGVSDALVAVRHLCPKSAFLCLNLRPPAAPRESINGRQKPQLYISIPLMPLVTEESETILQKTL